MEKLIMVIAFVLLAICLMLLVQVIELSKENFLLKQKLGKEEMKKDNSNLVNFIFTFLMRG